MTAAPVEIVVLVVDDEVLIQHLVEDALAEGGFQTAIAGSATSAIDMLNAAEREYRALVTDVDLKESVSGWDVARRARELHPDIPVVYMTGGSAPDWTAWGVPNSVLLTKPFAPAQVLTAVAQLLNAGAATNSP